MGISEPKLPRTCWIATPRPLIRGMKPHHLIGLLRLCIPYFAQAACDLHHIQNRRGYEFPPSVLEEQQVFVVLDGIGVGHDPFEFF
jgi:hypothetical protein